MSERLAELRAFVPLNAFDVHAHLYRHEDASPLIPRELEDAQGHVGRGRYDAALGEWLAERRPVDGLFFAFPHKQLDMPAANRFLVDEVRPHANSRALMMIRPGDDPDAVEAAVAAEGYAGFKVYHVYASRPDTPNAEIGEFLPDWAWQIADRHRLAITLHMVRRRALADPANQQYIRENCLRYPGAALILAHAARGFCGQHTVEGIASLRGLDNVYFDTSAICEPTPFEAILREFGPTRLLFGTDFPVSEMLGRCVSIGDDFLWLYHDTLRWQDTNARPQRVGVESLLALRQAGRTLHLNDRDIECIFGASARQLLRIGPAPRGEKTDAAYRVARRIIPGGTQLLSKRPEMYAPDAWPAYFAEAHGCEVVDLDGRRFCDMTTSGIGSCLLGYADPDVTAAVVRRVQHGSMSTLNAVEEVELAELLLSLHPWAEQARFCRTGGETMAAAVRIARAHTGRDRVAFCGYHGWQDWYLAANLPNAERVADSRDALSGHLLPGLAPAGVPAGLAGTALPFAYNQLDELQRHIERHGHEIAAVVMEPTRSTDPAPGFLEGVRELCNQCGTVLIFDEITCGWRLQCGGVHLRYGVEPDLVAFAKALGNGHPLGAVLGRRRVMDAAQATFLSSTFWTEGVGPAAGLATIRKMLRVDVPAHVNRIGELFRAGWSELARRHDLPVRTAGHAAILSLTFDHGDAAALATLFTRRMLDRGFLAGTGFYPSLAHTERHVDAYLAAASAVAPELAAAIAAGDAASRIGGTVRQSGFSRLT